MKAEKDLLIADFRELDDPNLSMFVCGNGTN